MTDAVGGRLGGGNWPRRANRRGSLLLLSCLARVHLRLQAKVLLLVATDESVRKSRPNRHDDPAQLAPVVPEGNGSKSDGLLAIAPALIPIRADHRERCTGRRRRHLRTMRARKAGRFVQRSRLNLEQATTSEAEREQWGMLRAFDIRNEPQGPDGERSPPQNWDTIREIFQVATGHKPTYVGAQNRSAARGDLDVGASKDFL
jgi:hypothetical protein